VRTLVADGATMNDTRYRINEPDVTAETFEEEVIVITLGNGRYHSLRGPGAWLWQALTDGLGRTEAIDRLLGANNADPQAAGQAAAFIDQHAAEELPVAAPERARGKPALLASHGAFLAPAD